MKLTLHTETTVDSCHKLEGYDGKCKNLHGHTWKIELWFKGDSEYKDKVGILIDFGIVKLLKEELDHKYLNDVLNMNPTAENLSEWVYIYVKDSIEKANRPEEIELKVRIYETAVDKKTYCECGDF